MIAAWYDRQGRAADVLQVGDLPETEPGPGEVRVRLVLSGINPGDIKKRAGWLGSAMAFPRIVPHSDGAGVIEAVGSAQHRLVPGSGCTEPSHTGPSGPRH
jgi:NADPH2:quinone reductase